MSANTVAPVRQMAALRDQSLLIQKTVKASQSPVLHIHALSYFNSQKVGSERGEGK